MVILFDFNTAGPTIRAAKMKSLDRSLTVSKDRRRA